MTKWTNDDDEIFETEDEARDRCYDMITEDDIVEVIKDSYIESSYLIRKMKHGNTLKTIFHKRIFLTLFEKCPMKNF